MRQVANAFAAKVVQPAQHVPLRLQRSQHGAYAIGELAKLVFGSGLHQAKSARWRSTWRGAGVFQAIPGDGGHGLA